MPSAQRSITINRPINEVFAYIADGENGPKWRSDKIQIKHESGEGVGAVYRQTVPGPVGRRVKADYEITAYQSPKRMDFKAIAGPVRPTGSYVLSTPAEGKTKVTFSLDAKVGLAKRLLMMGRMVQKSMDAEMLSLDKLKKVLEAQPAQAQAAVTKTSGAGAAAPKTAGAKPAAKSGPKPTSRRTPKKKDAPSNGGR
jgi:uncharacterized membrane protein